MTEVLNKLTRPPPEKPKSGRSVSPGDVRLQEVLHDPKSVPYVAKESWYAVRRGKGGRTGIFQSWGETVPLVNGVAGAVYKRFGNVDDVINFVQRYEAANFKIKEAVTEETHSSDFWYVVMNPRQDFYHIYPSWPEAMPHVTGVKGATCKKYRNYEDAREHSMEGSKGSLEELLPLRQKDAPPHHPWDDLLETNVRRSLQ
jgi:viroplasmin and RNaseH domain-containing protein